MRRVGDARAHPPVKVAVSSHPVDPPREARGLRSPPRPDAPEPAESRPEARQRKRKRKRKRKIEIRFWLD
ncbi:hypothetical protein EYF80_050825 [Liparis tanakae]|uniref:Uncharacterized protein n=1 Tax=Liparis tanakae TaxID=230148 RepID=A0A4Z2FDE2_9TELE|nr:hypothetical protein EYF80_050825 [Liparis tanakae]